MLNKFHSKLVEADLGSIIQNVVEIQYINVSWGKINANLYRFKR